MDGLHLLKMSREVTAMMLLLVVTLALLGSTAGQMQKNKTLYFTSPGEENRLGTVTRVPGIYGGIVDPKNRELAQNLFEKGYHCAEYSMETIGEYDPLNDKLLLDQLDIESLSFDRQTGDVLIKVRTDETTHLTVYRGSLCSGTHACRNNSLEAVFYNVQTPEQIGPLALSNGRVYFVVTKNERLSRTDQLRKVELRTLDGRCSNDFPLDQSSMFDVEGCSELIAVLAEEQYQNIVPVTAASTLVVLPTGTGTNPNFFVQLLYVHRDQTTKDISMKIVLKQVTPQKKVQDVHTEDVNKDFMQFEIQHMGGISVLDELFCWSAFDCIYCGHWDGQLVTDVKQKLKSGQGSQICSATSEALLANVITGVAISDSKAGDLYFGCIAQISSSGGLGYLRHDAAGHVTLTSVRSNYTGPAGTREVTYEGGMLTSGGEAEGFESWGGQAVFAGSMLLTDACEGPRFRAVSSASLPFLNFPSLLLSLVLVATMQQLLTTHVQ